MKNLKKVLSLVLALAMALSLMTVAFAADTDFSDSADIEYTEAVEVMAAIGVLEGSDGKFNPNGILTREQAAKIITYMLLGKDAAEKLTTSAAPFADVAADRWSAGSIAYCAEKGIIVGSNGKFNPTGKLTGHAFAKMLLVALGYDAKIQGYEGGKWAVNVASDAVVAGIDIDGVLMGNELTREQAAQMAFQTLTADMVKYASKGTNIELPDGTTVVTGASDAASYNGGTEYNNVTGANTSLKLQFCEQYFPKLTKEDGDDDDFGREASHKWQLDGEDVFNVVKTPVVTYTAVTKDSVIAKDLKGYTFNGTKLVDKDTVLASDWTVGEHTFDVSDIDEIAGSLAALTKNGRLVEIYADSNKAVDKVVVVNYTLGQVTNIVTSAKGDVTYTIAGDSDVVYADKDNGTDGVVFHNVAPAKNDYVLFTDETAQRHVYPVTSFTGKMTKYNATDNTMTIGGTVYTAGEASVGGTGLTQAKAFTGTANSTYYVDQYGYIVAVDGVNDIKYAVVDSIAYVAGSGVAASDYVEARLVFTDASTQMVKIDLIDGFKPIVAGTDLRGYSTSSASFSASTVSSAVAGTKYTVYGTGSSSSYTGENKFIAVSATAASNDTALKNKVYTYTINSDGNYELTTDASVSGGNATLKKGIPAVVGGKVGNDSTIYVVKTKDGTKSVWTVYTGYKAMPTMSGAAPVDAAWTTADGTVFVYVDASATSVGDTTSDVAFFFANEYTVDNTDTNKPLYEYTAILNGELKTVVATSDLSVSSNTLYKVTLNDNGQITAKANATNADFAAVQANGAPAAVGGVLTIDSTAVNSQTVTALTYDGTETIYFVHTVSKTVNTGVAADIADNAAIQVKTVDKTTDAGKIAISVAYVTVND